MRFQGKRISVDGASTKSRVNQLSQPSGDILGNSFKTCINTSCNLIENSGKQSTSKDIYFFIMDF